MKPSYALLPLLVAAPAYCAGNSNLVDLVPSDAQIFLGIRVRAVLDSELGRNVTAEVKAQTADLQKLVAASGFDPLHDLDEVLIASTGAGPKAPTIILARGKFDVARLAPNAEQYRGVPLLFSKAAKADGVFAFLDSSTALAGDLEMVKTTIDHVGEPAHLSAAIAAQVAEYRNKYDIWAVINRIDGLSQFVPPSNGAATAGLDAVDHIQFGVSIKKGVELAAEIHARSSKDAEQLSATLQFLEAMTKASQPAGSQGTKFAFKNEQGTLKISLAISEDDLKKAIENQRKGGMVFGARPIPRGGALATVTPPQPAPAPAAPISPAPVEPALPAPAPVAPPTVASVPADAPPVAPAPPVAAAPVAPAPVRAQAPSKAAAPPQRMRDDTDTRTTVVTLPGAK